MTNATQEKKYPVAEETTTKKINPTLNLNPINSAVDAINLAPTNTNDANTMTVKLSVLDASLSEEEYDRLTELFKQFACNSRLKILFRLTLGECSASELAESAQMSQSATSHQLKDLKLARIIKSRKAGKQVFYSLDDHHVLNILKIGKEHLRGEHCCV